MTRQGQDGRGGVVNRYAWRDLGARPFVFPALSLMLGAAGNTARTETLHWLFLSVAAVLSSAAWAFARLPGSHLAVLLALGAVGAGLAGLEARVELPPGLLSGGAAVLEGELERVDHFDDAVRLHVAVARVGAKDAPTVPARFRASLTVQGRAPPLLPGQRIHAEARLQPLEPAGNPGEKDFTPLRRRRAFVFTGSVQAGRLLVVSPAPAWRQYVERTQQGLSQAVRAVAPSEDAAALFLTLAAGQRASLDDALEDAFSRSGLAHVLSVSGLHVAALALMTLALLRRLLVRVGVRLRGMDARRVAAPASIPFVWAYVLFTGNQPPAVRSAVMATVVLLGLALWRRADGLNSLAAAAVVLAVWAPSSVGDLSLQLSFLAVMSLLLLTPALRGAVPIAPPDAQEKRRLVRIAGQARETILETFCASVAVTVASLPLVASAFGRASLAGLISNIVCLPLCGLLTGFAAGGAALFTVAPVLATPVLWGGAWTSEVLLVLTRFFAAVPLATVDLPPFGAVTTLLYAAGLGAWALGTGRWRFAGLATPLALILALLLPWLLPQPPLRITFLSVGQGDAAVISSRGQHALVDGGGVPQGADTGARFVLPFLAHERIGRLALTVLSHPHPDHALGLISTLGQVPTAQLWLPSGTTQGALSQKLIAAAGQAQVKEVEVGTASFPLGEATLEVLGPPPSDQRDLLEGVNDQSVVVLVRHGNVTVLLAGDVEEAGEEALLEHLGPVTVLKAPHHGSRTSSTPPFVDRTQPRYVIFCVGRRNRFGFPHPEVEARYRARGTECFRTDLDGAVTLESDGKDVRLHTFLPREASPAAPAVVPVVHRPQP
ncbi:DNA internalization-like competence protein ComEC/Rec2 [Stigmatella aurantiaca DW4/3-1]|uniref:DNA internalization-like competence protein ComEC/Rec2 n=1 Tax=Stigmatella aurantiaca (strain DW4/3-1) TaxID=378806 RepID=E3FYM5_STIAD|nr:DNA internalization-like competence protein ComEC/Rec2 [Stigmatella aurantiaca DW4/3-1]